MAEGADGEEEIQFLRTVSDAARLSSAVSEQIESQCVKLSLFYIKMCLQNS